MFDLSLGEMLWSRRTIFMALVVGGPVLLALIVRVLELFGMSAAARQRPAPWAASAIFGVMIWMLFLRFIVPGARRVLRHGADGGRGGGQDDHLPVHAARFRAARCWSGKYLAYLACTMLVVLPSVMIVYFLLVPFREVPGTFASLLTDLGLLALGLAVYGAVFAFVGAYFKRPLVIGLVFAFGWEQTVMVLPGYLKQFTVAYYLQALVPHAMPSDGVTSLLQGMFLRDTPPLSVAWSGWPPMPSAFCVWRPGWSSGKEYILEQ